MHDELPGWVAYEPSATGSVVGRVLRSEEIFLPDLERSLRLWAWLPGAPGDAEPMPVLYMHDGDNLFDDAASNAGEWRVDEVLTELGRPCIVIGIPNAGERRMHEYCPWPNHFTDDVVGDRYARVLVDAIVPFVEASLPVSPRRDHRGVMGSSLGGVISLYAFVTYPSVFGFVGSMSTAAWWTPAIWPFLDGAEAPPGRIYLDVGTNEMPTDPDTSRAYVDAFHRLRRWALDAGYGRDLLAVEEVDAIHHESAWSRRLPAALEFLLPSS